MMHNKPAAKSLLYNLYSQENRGIHIDSMLDCVERAQEEDNDVINGTTTTTTVTSPHCAAITDLPDELENQCTFGMMHQWQPRPGRCSSWPVITSAIVLAVAFQKHNNNHDRQSSLFASAYCLSSPHRGIQSSASRTFSRRIQTVPRIPSGSRRWKTSHNDNHSLLRASSHETGVLAVVEGPFRPSQLESFWGRRPLLIRNAFPEAAQLRSEQTWPNGEDVLEWASYRDGENNNDAEEKGGGGEDFFYGDDEEEETPVMSRLIRKENERMDSFSLELGPFPKPYLDELLSTSDSNSQKEGTWTLLLNDVDRIHPPLSEWMNRTFGSFLPGWRIDDGQISVAKPGGGIGPHVDNYDVFLIQTSGKRQWLLSDFISTQQEMDALIEGLEVRILDLDHLHISTEEDTKQKKPSQTTVEMNEGDMLYLPPRLIHWGTSQSDDCMTLSVGCRAPSATELVSKVAEHLAYSTAPKAVKRYSDLDLLSNTPQYDHAVDVTNEDGSISSQVKNELKQMVLDAVEDILDDPVLWDEIVGATLTVPKRPIETYSNYDKGETISSIDNNSNSPQEHVHAALQRGTGALYPAEGVSFATSQVKGNDYTYHRIYADGHKFEWTIALKEKQSDVVFGSILSAIEKRRPLDSKVLDGSSVKLPAQALLAISLLVERGYLYYFDEEEAQQEQN